MTDVEGLTDAELRTKLLEFGFPVMPITGTTRKVMVKKLKLLMENKNKINAEGRRSLSRYSSEEDSDVEVKAKVKESKNRRATMAAPVSMPAPPTSKLPLRKKRGGEGDVEPSSDERKVVTSTTSTRTTKIVKAAATAAAQEYDTGSDSESEVYEHMEAKDANNHYEEERRVSPPKMPSTRYSSIKERERISPPKMSGGLSESFSRTYTSTTTNSTSPGRYTSNYNSPASDYASDKLNQIRSRLSLGNSNYDRPSYSSSLDKNQDEDPTETPFLSNFTKRLSQISSQKDGGDYKNIIKENDTNGSSPYIRGYTSRVPRSREYSRDYQGSQDSSNRKTNMISCVLIGVVLLFFIVLAVLYLGIHNGGSMVEQSGHNVPKCSASNPNAKPGHNCIFAEDVQDAIDIYTILKPELFNKAVQHLCRDSSVKPYMTEVQVIHFIKQNYGLKNEQMILKNLKNFEVLLFANPKWDVSIIQSTTPEDFPLSPIENMDTVLTNRGSMSTALAVLNPNLPWKCSIYIKLTAIFNTLFFLAGLIGSVYGGRYAYKYYKHYCQKQKDEVFFMVERIVDILQSNASEGDDNFLVINHVRDMILPINERSAMQRTWNKAVKFINENDSRIRMEVQVVKGETCDVWRWLGPSRCSSPNNKTWQGQAFETQAGSVNSLLCSPTPCLKIRGMVEEGDRNLLTIREAVLGKCAHQCRILHCAVDNNARCVYLKCASKEDAAIAYRNLHGWWYSGHLVTVKYLRVERYMQRYKDAPVSGPPFLKAVKPCDDWTN